MTWWKERKTRRLIIFIILALASAYLLYLVRGLLFSFILAAFITYLLNPLVNAMERKGTPRTWAILLAYLALSFVGASIALYGVPRTIEQLNGLSETIPLYTEQIRELIQSIQTRYVSLNIPEAIKQVLDEQLQWVEGHMLEFVSKTVAALIGTVGYIFKILLAPVLSFYILKDLELIKKKAVMTVPEEWRKETFGLFKDIDRVLGSFIRGYLLVASIVAGMTTVAMAILGMEFALMLGLFAGLTELIPYFGPLIGAIPAVGLALLKSKWLGIKVALAFLIIHQLEGNIISPKILGDRVGLHPLIVIFSLLAGGELYGLTGMLLAVPAAAIIGTILKFIYFKAITEYRKI